MIVVDTNVIAFLLIDGEKTQDARAVFEADSRWQVPTLWRHEFLNVMATYLKAGGISLSHAERMFHQAEKFMRPFERDLPDMSMALRVAHEKKLSAYDAQYLALAQVINCMFVTEDGRVQRAAPDQAISMRSFLSR